MKTLHIPYRISSLDDSSILRLDSNFTEIQNHVVNTEYEIQGLKDFMAEIRQALTQLIGIEDIKDLERFRGPRGYSGSHGPGLVYRGVYGSGETYYYIGGRRDVVYYGGKYYMFNVTLTGGVTVGAFDAGQWAEFGDEFSSIATGLLLAEDAAITKNLHVGGGEGSGIAGMSGVGILDASIRFWSGHLDRTIAPFRVQNDGTTYTKNLQAFGDGARSLSIGVDAESEGDDSVAVGNSAISSGDNTVAVGRNATSAGVDSVAVGRNATSAGVNSTALGRDSSAASGSSTAVGSLSSSEGINGVALGNNASAGATNSTALGSSSSAAGNDSTALGSGSSAAGYRSTVSGYFSSAAGDNSTALGNGASATANNSVRIGNSDVTSIGGYAEWSNVSDERDKIDIQSSEHGLNIITKLNPIKYKLDPRKRYEEKDKHGKVTKHKKDGSKANERHSCGFSAQELAIALRGTDLDVVDDNDPEQLGVRSADLIPILVKAVQELAAEVEILKEGNVTSKD